MAMYSFAQRLTATLIMIGLMNADPARGQTLSFEAATIKLSLPAVPGQAVSTRIVCHSVDLGPPEIPKGRCVVIRRPLLDFVAWAYNLQRPMVSGGPEWARSVAFDIEAKAEDLSTATYAQLRSMFQTLLADRFHLAFHRETRDAQGYLLAIAKGGAKLKEAPKDGATSAVQTRSSASYRNFGIAQLVLFLSTITGRPVIDRTGLTRRYDLELKWTPSELEGARDATADSQPGPSLFTALQEQLGLRLESSRVPAEYLIVDGADMPTSN